MYEETKLSKILSWSCHSDSNPKPLAFTLKEIYDFIKVNADESKSDETWKKLTNILKKQYSLFKSNGENVFESFNCNIEFKIQHLEKLLYLNFPILEKSYL